MVLFFSPLKDYLRYLMAVTPTLSSFSFLTVRLNLCYTDLVIIRYLIIQPFPLKSVLPFYFFSLLIQGRHILCIQKIITDCEKP